MDYYNKNNQSNQESSAGSKKCCDNGFLRMWRWTIIIIIALCCFGLFLTVILVPVSLSYVEPGEVGLPKNRITGDVNENGRIYKMDLQHNGRYFTGLKTTIHNFDARIQQEELTLDVIASNSREFQLKVLVTYRINSNELGKLFVKFTQNWKTPAKNEAIATIKSVAPQFSIDDYVNKLEYIRQEMAKTLAVELKNNHLSIVDLGIIILRVDFTGEIDQQFLRNVVQTQNNERQLIQRDVDIIVQDTETQKSAIFANRTLTIATGAAQAELIVNTARAEAARVREIAKTIGFTNLFNHFNVSDPALKTRFLEWYVKKKNVGSITIIDGVPNAIINLGA